MMAGFPHGQHSLQHVQLALELRRQRAFQLGDPFSDVLPQEQV
jgi:hypothetical protein